MERKMRRGGVYALENDEEKWAMRWGGGWVGHTCVRAYVPYTSPTQAQLDRHQKKQKKQHATDPLSSLLNKY